MSIQHCISHLPQYTTFIVKMSIVLISQYVFVLTEITRVFQQGKLILQCRLYRIYCGD